MIDIVIINVLALVIFLNKCNDKNGLARNMSFLMKCIRLGKENIWNTKKEEEDMADFIHRQSPMGIQNSSFSLC